MLHTLTFRVSRFNVRGTMAKRDDGFLRWLGRQVGYVKKAVQADPTPTPQLPAAAREKKLYENKIVEETPHPENPNVKLRRTIIDEAIQKKDEPPMNTDAHR